MLHKLLKSIIDSDPLPVVVCDVNSVIVYMNPSALTAYKKDLVGKSLMNCHNDDSRAKIEKVLKWFGKSKENNMVFTYHDTKDNKDVYMIALRDADGNLIGYYEKHECRSREQGKAYDI